mmetsp:Transcript_46636/g.141298  ORF Transcript_46636/g.141298 Transcript_46636/m.141298 type:complete len:316 (-) Transcript_46636:255-1202(-)
MIKSHLFCVRYTALRHLLMKHEMEASATACSSRYNQRMHSTNYMPALSPNLSRLLSPNTTRPASVNREVPGVSKQLRSEFARGDGRIKRKEDDRRKRILPSETLFVVNFHEQTTKREDLQMLFSPFGEIVRIDMKRNYAFVQFTNIEDAKRAKEATNGGKLDQSVITVEFVARRMGDADRRRERGDRDRQRDRAPAYGRGSDNGRGYGRRDDYDDRRGGNRGRDDRYDDYRGRDRSPGRDRWGYRGRGRSRSRSRSPGGYRHRSRSPSPSYRKHRDDYRDRDGRGRSPDRDHRDSGRGRSPDRDYRGDRDRGYRS